MSISHLYPSISPSLSLNFARSKTLDPRITFTRTSTGTRTNELGLIEVVPADAPRFDHRYENDVVKSLGLLIEEQRTNFALISQRHDFNWILQVSGGSGTFIDGETVTTSTTGATGVYVASLSNSIYFVARDINGYPAGTITGSTSGATRNIASFYYFNPSNLTTTNPNITNEVLSPDGTYNATLVVPKATGTQLRTIGKRYTTSTAGTYTFSIFFKNKNISNNLVAIYIGNQTSLSNVVFNFNLTTKTFSGGGNGGWTGSSGYQEYPNGWMRIWVTATTTEGSHTFLDGSFWLGGYQGTAETIGSMYVWESQIETGAFPTSQIQTTYSTATRTVDAVSMTGTNFSSWFNQTEGTLFADFMGKTIRSSLTFDRYIAIVGNDPNLDEMGFYTQTADGGGVYKKIGGVITKNAVSQIPGFVSGGGGPDFGGKAILAYKYNDASYTINGVTPVTDNTVELPTFVGLRIFGRARYQPEPSGHISQFIYYPKRLPDTQLINLTK